MEFTEELYRTAFDKALCSCDEALEAMQNGLDEDPQLVEKYRVACKKLGLLMARWDREGHMESRGSLIDIWYRTRA